MVPYVSFWSLLDLSILIMSVSLYQTDAQPQQMQQLSITQYFQMVHSDADNSKDTISSVLENDTRIVLLASHSYDICCFSQPLGSRNRLHFDESMFREHISNYQHAQSVTSCIQTIPDRRSVILVSGTADFNRTVVCDSVGPLGVGAVSGWFYYDVSVPPQLDCNFTKLTGTLQLGQELQLECKFSSGWPLATPRCWIGNLTNDKSSLQIQLDTKAMSQGEATMLITLPQWSQFYGKTLHCSATQACPPDSVCSRDVLAVVQSSTQFKFRVKSHGTCKFSSLADRNSTQIRCASTQGYPDVRHTCSLVFGNKTVNLIANSTTSINSSGAGLVSDFLAPLATARVSNVSVTCAVQQDGFPNSVFSHTFPVEREVTIATGSINWAPIIVSLAILLIILIVILIMVAVALRRRHSAGEGRAESAAQTPKPAK